MHATVSSQETASCHSLASKQERQEVVSSAFYSEIQATVLYPMSNLHAGGRVRAQLDMILSMQGDPEAIFSNCSPGGQETEWNWGGFAPVEVNVLIDSYFTHFFKQKNSIDLHKSLCWLSINKFPPLIKAPPIFPFCPVPSPPPIAT